MGCADNIPTRYFPFNILQSMTSIINYQLNSSIYVAIGGHCYATLIKTDIHLIAFNRLVYKEIPLSSAEAKTHRHRF